ncbi:MAG: hypothetical protein CMB45_05415 [Euryarchaeota archaeon]|nr:hypothetical protein [Euryarchaeota archaeon]MBK38412.1 hypothetical protein [Euryarchaeota archaeon]|tara:strand:- start:12764 stop:13183 length:420 start_codon:yes stop_codon:yes gene_type:complete
MARDSGVSPSAPHVNLSTGGGVKKPLSGQETTDGVALLVSDTGRTNFSTTSHPQGTIGTAKVKLSEIALNKATVISKRGFLLKASSGNSGTIHIGTTNVSTTNGMVLEAGDSIFIDITNSDNIYLIGSGAGQNIFWMDM